MPRDFLYKTHTELLSSDIDAKDESYYVYIFCDGDIPFYVGMGRKNRWKTHFYYDFNKNNLNNNPKVNKIKKMVKQGLKVKVHIVAKHLSKNEACLLEKRLINFYGRYCDGGTLANLSTGGEAGTQDYKHPEGVRKKMSINSRGSTSSVNEELVYKAKLLVHYKGYSIDDLLKIKEFSSLTRSGIQKWFSRSSNSYKYVAPHLKTSSELREEKVNEVINLYLRDFTRKQISDILGLDYWFVKSVLRGR